MGAGEFPCGTTPCGLDGLVSTGRTRPEPPAALGFDGQTKDFMLDARGRYVGEHPVDAKVFLIVRTALRSMRSAPMTGQTLTEMQYIEPLTIQSLTENKLTTALAAVVAAGEIQIHSIDVDTSVPGRLAARLNYTNLVTRRRIPLKVT